MMRETGYDARNGRTSPLVGGGGNAPIGALAGLGRLSSDGNRVGPCNGPDHGYLGCQVRPGLLVGPVRRIPQIGPPDRL